MKITITTPGKTFQGEIEDGDIITYENLIEQSIRCIFQGEVYYTTDLEDMLAFFKEVKFEVNDN